MSNHDYTAQEALEALLQLVEQRVPGLLHRIKLAIDSGTEDQDEEAVKGKGKKNKIRKYNINRPYTAEEALEVALGVLQAYFVETPLFINSALSNFEKTAIGATTKTFAGYGERGIDLEDEGKPKKVQIELHTETQISRATQEMFSLEYKSAEEINKQRENLDQLKNLVTFS